MPLRPTRPPRPRDDAAPTTARPPIWAEGRQHPPLAAGPFLRASLTLARAQAQAGLAGLAGRLGPGRPAAAALAARAAARLGGVDARPGPIPAQARPPAAPRAPAPAAAVAARSPAGAAADDATLREIRRLMRDAATPPAAQSLPEASPPARPEGAAPPARSAALARLLAQGAPFVLGWGLCLLLVPLGAAQALRRHLDGEDLRDLH